MMGCGATVGEGGAGLPGDFCINRGTYASKATFGARSDEPIVLT